MEPPRVPGFSDLKSTLDRSEVHVESKELPNTAAYKEEREKLKRQLRGPFDDLVRWYRYFAVKHHSHPFVSYKVLADLIREGWRLSADPTE